GAISIISGYFLTFGLTKPDLHADSNTIKAALLSVLAAFSFGSSTVFSKEILKKVDFITATFFRYGTTFLLLLPIIIVTGLYNQINELTTTNWIVISIISITTGSGAIFLYYLGLRHVKASISTISELFFPLTAIILDYYINGNLLSPVQWLSAAIMIFSIIKANLEKKKTI
ncbi:MAG TPA: EamA family transporter, partial [Bacteroidetes bacterium]|nr:EamA family transporter [Bacteroidota bacterium]